MLPSGQSTLSPQEGGEIVPLCRGHLIEHPADLLMACL